MVEVCKLNYLRKLRLWDYNFWVSECVQGYPPSNLVGPCLNILKRVAKQGKKRVGM